MRAARLIQLMLLLEDTRHTTAAALAERLGVSVRTVHRDLDALAQSGVPVYTERGRGGGCHLMDGYKVRPGGITGAEADALFFSGIPTAAAELGLESLVATAQLKVRAGLPKSVRQAARMAEQRFHLDPPGWFRTRMPDHPQLQDVASAVWSDQRLVIGYYSGAGRASTVQIDPLGLVLKAGLWYLVARAEAEIRAYRISRIAQITTTQETFQRPEGFDLARFWTDWATEFESTRTAPYSVVLRIPPDALAEVEDLDTGPVVAIEREPDGWLRVTVQCQAERWARRAVLELGTRAEVVEPMALRTYMLELARGLERLYG